jgi:hypothetical protein
VDSIFPQKNKSGAPSGLSGVDTSATKQRDVDVPFATVTPESAVVQGSDFPIAPARSNHVDSDLGQIVVQTVGIVGVSPIRRSIGSITKFYDEAAEQGELVRLGRFPQTSCRQWPLSAVIVHWLSGSAAWPGHCALRGLTANYRRLRSIAQSGTHKLLGQPNRSPGSTQPSGVSHSRERSVGIGG